MISKDDPAPRPVYPNGVPHATPQPGTGQGQFYQGEKWL